MNTDEPVPTNGPTILGTPMPLAPAPAPDNEAWLHLEHWQTKESFHPLRPVESVETRFEQGKALRRRTPREAHAEWKPASNRPDPVQMVLASNEGRQPDLVPLRMGRMSASPFAFFRGTAGLMASDLSHTPISGMAAVIDGDAHLNNFGLYGTPQRDVVVDLNDFDESAIGPWEWDLTRLATSVNLAARDLRLNRKKRRAAVQKCVAGYVLNLDRLMSMGILEVWSLFAYADLSRYEAEGRRLDLVIGESFRAVLGKVLEKARRTTSATLLQKVARRQPDGGWRFVEQAPVLKRCDDESRSKIIASLVEYGETVPRAYRLMLQRYSVADVAHRVVGVGSVGMRAYLALLFGNSENDPLFLQIKQSAPSALIAHLPAQDYQIRHEGQRVVAGQRSLQAMGDPLLGHTTIDGRPYFVRQMKNMKASMPIEEMNEDAFVFWSHVCGLLLARAHARTGDAAKLAGYVGKSDVLANALADFAETYGDQVEKDHEAFQAEIDAGRIPVLKEGKEGGD